MVDPSSRVTCEHAESCPGCPLIELSYGEQLEAKRRRVTECIEGFYDLRASRTSAPIGAEPITDYRQRTKLAVRGRAIGLYARGSHRVLDLPACRVQDPLVFDVIARVRHLLTPHAPLVALDVARVLDGALVTLVVDEGVPEAELQAFAERLRAADERIVGVALSRHESDSPRLLGRAPRPIIGAERVETRLQPEGPFHYVTFGTFAQAHAGQERALVEAIVTALEAQRPSRGARILELFAGSGALALTLSKRGARVHAVEAFPPAAELIGAAARDQGLEVVVETNDAEAAVVGLSSRGERVDAVVLNPPRRGLSPALRRGVVALAPEMVVYVSCEPRTLARDLADFARRGLSPRALVPYDMMPLTEEVETLAVLAHAPLPLPESIYADERLIAVVKSPHEPTTPQGEHEGSLLRRVRLFPDGDRAVPAHRLDAGTSGVCLFARRPEYADELGRALAAGQKEYVALVQGVSRKKGTVNRPLVEHGRARDAKTRYVRLDVVGGHSLVAVFPDQGRKHQVRRHLASIGYPVIGDERYGDERTNAYFAMKHGLDRPFLHAREIKLTLGGRELVLVAPLAPDLELVRKSLVEARSLD